MSSPSPTCLPVDLPIPQHVAFDWSDAEDKDNPRNYSRGFRIFSTMAVTLLAFVTTFAASIYAPSQESVARQFNCSDTIAILPLALFNLGLAFGPLIGAPLSETYGRKIVFLATSPVFAILTIGAATSQSVTGLIICRLFAGIFAAPAISNASATITDFTAIRYRAISLGIYYSIPTAGALVGPLVGGFVIQVKSWRWEHWTAVMVLAALYIPVCFTRETYKKRILQRRAQKLGIDDAWSRKRTPSQMLRYFITTLLTRPVHMLATEPIVTFICLYGGFLFGLIYCYVSVVPWVFEHYYGFGGTGQSLAFLGLITGALTAPIPLVLLDARLSQPKLEQWQSSHNDTQPMPPEHRLVPAMIGSWGLPIVLLGFAWTAHYSSHWIVPILFQGLAMFSAVMVYSSTNLYMLDTYGPLYGASAAGAAMLTRYLFSFAFPLFSLRLFTALGVGWGGTLLALCTLLMVPIPWVFYRYGESIRRRSRYETSQ